MRQELRHLTDRREDEVGNALALVAAEAEGVDPSQAMLLPEARQLAADEEVDALVRIKTPRGDVMYVASHKNHSNSKFALQEGAGAHWPPPAGRRQDASGGVGHVKIAAARGAQGCAVVGTITLGAPIY